MMYTGSLPATSNRSSWSETFNLYDSETGDAVDLTGTTIVLQLSDRGCWAPRLTATTAVVDTGIFEASLTLDQMRTLCAETYEIGCTVTDNASDETVSFMIVTLSVLYGDVS